MAAFEAVSKLNIRPVDAQSFLDVRSARLPDGRLPKDEFDPRLYREPRNPITTWMAYFNILRSLFGAGMLGMPLAISQAGMVLGPLLVIFTGCLIIHMHLTLLNCLNEMSRQLHIPQVSYRYGFRMALLHGPPMFHCIGKRGPTIIAVLMIMSQLGICTVFVTFTSDSLRDIMDWQSNQPALLALLLPYLLLEFAMKSLKIVSYVSMLGNFLNAVGLFLVFYHIFKDPHGELIRAANEALPLLFAFGTILFNLSAVGVVLSLDKALEDPRIMTKKFGVITIGISITTIVSIVFGGLGYWSFGTMEENILRSLPFDDITTFIAIGLYLVAVALAYPIQCYPAIQIILEVVRNYSMDTTPSDATLKIIEWVARPLFVCLSFIVCYCVPYQAPFVAFVGNLCTTILALVFPAIMELSLLYPGQYGKCNLYLIKNIIVIFIGMTSWVFGVVVSAYLIYVRLLSSNSPNDN